MKITIIGDSEELDTLQYLIQLGAEKFLNDNDDMREGLYIRDVSKNMINQIQKAVK